MIDRLLKGGNLSSEELDSSLRAAEASGKPIEDILLAKGVPKHEILLGLSAEFSCPFVE